MQYRREIDGLRALAVLPVVLYHLQIGYDGFRLLPGGFLGVDIFFVLSGYLITHIILTELRDTGGVSLRRFYVRRARRILPLLLLVILASLLAAPFLLLPSEAERMAWSVLASLAFVSNFFWYYELGSYGAADGLVQPFLHTWSLAIEEQFYLVFPLLMIVMSRWLSLRGMLWGLGIAALASLAAAHAMTLTAQDASFFSPLSRAWELLAGSLLAALAVFRPGVHLRDGTVLRLLPKLALAGIAAAMWFTELQTVTHPGLSTLPVVLATAVLIWCARPGEAVTRFLSWAPMVFTGRLSYSVYLWHFPVFAFGRLADVNPPDTGDKVLWVLITLALSVGSYYLVERPFRFSAGRRLSLTSLAVSLTVVAGFVTLMVTTDRLSHVRAERLAALYGAPDYDNEYLRQQSWQPLRLMAEERGMTHYNNPHAPSPAERETLWFDRPARLNVLIVGNSHAKDLFNAFYLNAEAFPDVSFARFAVHASFPQLQQDQLFQSPNFRHSDLVLIASQYRQTNLSLLPGFVHALRAQGKQVALVGNTAEFRTPGIVPVFDWYIRQWGREQTLRQVNQTGYGLENTWRNDLNTALRGLALDLGVPFLSRRALMCDDTAGRCYLVTPGGRKTMYDESHWTLAGAAWFGQRAAAAGWLDRLLAVSAACPQGVCRQASSLSVASSQP